MPAAIPALISAGLTTIGVHGATIAGVTIGWGAAAAIGLGVGALTYWASSMTPDGRPVSRRSSYDLDTMLTNRLNVVPVAVLYGCCVAPGNIAYASAVANARTDASIICILGHGEIDRVASVSADGIPIEAIANAQNHWEGVVKPWLIRGFWEGYTGTSSQDPVTNIAHKVQTTRYALTSPRTFWKQSTQAKYQDTNEGEAYRDLAYTAIYLGEKPFGISSRPNILSRVWGQKCTSFTGNSITYPEQFSRNPGRILLDYLVRYLGVDTSDIDLDSFGSLVE
ncbi:MAG: hypothetical protein ABIH23_31745, partial [bacterium]